MKIGSYHPGAYVGLGACLHGLAGYIRYGTVVFFCLLRSSLLCTQILRVRASQFESPEGADRAHKEKLRSKQAPLFFGHPLCQIW